MRIYWGLTTPDLASLTRGEALVVAAQRASSPTAGFAATVETDDADELAVLAALAVADSADDIAVIGVLDTEGVVVDDEIGEVEFAGSFKLEDFACLLIADVENEELQWFGIQEMPELLETLGMGA